MDKEKIFIYCHKSDKRRNKGLYSDVAVVKSNNLKEAKEILLKYYDKIDTLVEIKFEGNKNIIIVSDY